MKFFFKFFKNCPKWYFHENNFFKFFIHLKIIFNELIHFSKFKKKIIKLILIKLNLFKIFKSILKNFPRFSWRLSVEWQTTRSGQLPHENVDQGETICIQFAYSLAANSNQMTSLTALDVGRDSDLNRNTPISFQLFPLINLPLFL